MSRAAVLGDGTSMRKGHRARPRPGKEPRPARDLAPVPNPVWRFGDARTSLPVLHPGGAAPIAAAGSPPD